MASGLAKRGGGKVLQVFSVWFSELGYFQTAKVWDAHEELKEQEPMRLEPDREQHALTRSLYFAAEG